MRRRLMLAVAMAALGGLPARAADVAVTIDNFTFAPSVLTVAKGTMVVWTNRDNIPHSVVGDGPKPLFRSHPLDTGDAFSMTFDAPGVYRYFCGLHPHMQGTIVVK